MFSWSSLYDSLPEWNKWILQQQLYLSNTKSLGVLNYTAIDLIILTENHLPVLQPAFVNNPALSAAQNIIQRQIWVDYESRYERDFRQYKDQVKILKDLDDMHANAFNCYADSFMPESVIMIERDSIVSRSLERYRQSLVPFDTAGILPVDAIARVHANDPNDQVFITHWTPLLHTRTAAIRECSSLNRFRAMEEYLRLNYKPGHPSQQTLLVKMLTELRDNIGSIFDVHIQFVHLCDLIATATGSRMTEVQLQLYFRGIFTDNRFDSVLSEMQFESTRPIPAGGPLWTVDYCWERILTACRMDPKKDIYSSRQPATAKAVVNRQVFFAQGEPALKKPRIIPSPSGGDRTFNRNSSASGGVINVGNMSKKKKKSAWPQAAQWAPSQQYPPQQSSFYIDSQPMTSSLPPQRIQWYPQQQVQMIPSQSYPIQYVNEFNASTSTCFRCGNIGHPAASCVSQTCVNCRSFIGPTAYHNASTCTGTNVQRPQNPSSGRYGRGAPSGRGAGGLVRGRGFGRGRG